jgi:hypothetical protein
MINPHVVLDKVEEGDETSSVICETNVREAVPQQIGVGRKEIYAV